MKKRLLFHNGYGEELLGFTFKEMFFEEMQQCWTCNEHARLAFFKYNKS